jgi:hypothetical protein
MHKLKPNLLKLAVFIMAASLFTACTPAPLVNNKEDCQKPPQVEECRRSNQHPGGSGYVSISRGGSRSNIGGENSKTSGSGVSFPKSSRVLGNPFFSGRTGFGSFGRGGFGLG